MSGVFVVTCNTVSSRRAEGVRRVELSALKRLDPTVVLASVRRRVEAVADGSADENGVGGNGIELFVSLKCKKNIHYEL
jgi:hypothetical protein